MGLLLRFGRICMDLVVIFLVIIFVPGIPPRATFTSYSIDSPRKLEGPLESNSILDDGERLFEGRINGPESIASRKSDEIFVSLHGGKIMRIWGNNFQNSEIVASIGPGCAGPWEEDICGRPLGLRFSPDGTLLVADSYLGLFALDVDTGEKTMILDAKEAINGTVALIVDDLDITEEGDIYFSDASTIANLANGVTELFSDPSGRLLKYNIKSQTSTAILNKLHFANGVQLSPNQDFVLVCETFRSRVIRYWLKGPRTGETEIFLDGLPGMPDNIRAKPGGGYLISLISVHKEDQKWNMTKKLAQLPWIRKLLMRLLTLTRIMFETTTMIFPNEHTSKLAYNLLNLAPLIEMYGHNHCIVVVVDENGDILSSLQGFTGKIKYISEAHQVGNHLFFGSPYNNYLGHLLLKQSTPQSNDAIMEPVNISIGGGKATTNTVSDKDEL